MDKLSGRVAGPELVEPSRPLARIASIPNWLLYKIWNAARSGIFHGVINGIPFTFYDPGGPAYYWKSFLSSQLYEHSVVVHLKGISNRFDTPVLLDAGAHYGFFTVYMSKLNDSRGRVISIEPNRQTFSILSTNVRLNGLRNVSLHQIALSDKEGVVRLRGPKTHLDTSDGPYEVARAKPFDHLAQAQGLHPDIVKIDVHGAEGNVVSGMKRTISRYVSALYCEVHPEMIEGSSPNDIVDTLQDAGMEVFQLLGFRTSHGRLVPLDPCIFREPWEHMIFASK